MPTRNVNLKRELLYDAKLARLRAAIDEGDASGLAEGDVFAHVREGLHLPANDSATTDAA